jgi:hypothetical protein
MPPPPLSLFLSFSLSHFLAPSLPLCVSVSLCVCAFVCVCVSLRYGLFCSMEARLFRDINRRPKPMQPTRSVAALIRASVRTDPSFHAAMAGVVVELNRQRRVLPVGGVVYKPAAIKKAARIVEKLVLDPTQASARTARDADLLDARGVLDTVRGMFVCNTMAHAVELLSLLAERARAGAFEFVRSKNRFAR